MSAVETRAVPVLCNELGFEPVVISRRVVEDIGFSYGNLTLYALRARITPPSADRRTCSTDATSHGSERAQLVSFLASRKQDATPASCCEPSLAADTHRSVRVRSLTTVVHELCTNQKTKSLHDSEHVGQEESSLYSRRFFAYS